MDEPELFVPQHLAGGVFANHVEVFEDVEYLTLDFASLDPRDPVRGIVVARVSLPTSCILTLEKRLGHLR